MDEDCGLLTDLSANPSHHSSSDTSSELTYCNDLTPFPDWSPPARFLSPEMQFSTVSLNASPRCWAQDSSDPSSVYQNLSGYLWALRHLGSAPRAIHILSRSTGLCLAPPLGMQLPDSDLRDWMMTQVLRSPATHVGNSDQIPDLGFELIQLWPLLTFGEWTARWIISFFFSLPFCFTSK